MKRRPTRARRALIQARAQLRRGLRKGGQAVQKCSQVQHCSANEQWYAPARMNLRDAGDGVCHKLPSGIALRGLTDVDEVVRDALTQLAWRLRGAYVEAPINESRVHADDLDSGLVCKTNGPIALPDTGRPRQNKNRQLATQCCRGNIHQRPRKNS